MSIDIRCSARTENMFPAAVQRIRDGVRTIEKLVRVDWLINDVRITPTAAGNRGFFSPRFQCIVMGAGTKSFQPNYRGWKYATFGGVKDLTPGGVFAHELGHALDFMEQGSLTADFDEIRRAPKKFREQAPTGYAASDPGEDVAESFRLYVTNPKALRKICPRRFSVLHELIVEKNLMNMRTRK